MRRPDVSDSTSRKPQYVADDYPAIAKAMHDLGLGGPGLAKWGIWYLHEEKWCWIDQDGRLKTVRAGIEPTLYSSKEALIAELHNLGIKSSGIVPKIYS